MTKIILYTDGGSRGNPGPAGVGAVAIEAETEKVILEAKQQLAPITNNEAEYQAVLLGLESLKKKFGQERLKTLPIEHRLDSELVCKQLNGEYQIKEERLWPYFMKIWNQKVANFHQLTHVHIPREENCRADQLANEAMDGN